MHVTRVTVKQRVLICDGCNAVLKEEAVEISDDDGYTSLFCDRCSAEMLAGLTLVMRPVDTKLN